jgi:hypothetical protein
LEHRKRRAEILGSYNHQGSAQVNQFEGLALQRARISTCHSSLAAIGPLEACIFSSWTCLRVIIILLLDLNYIVPDLQIYYIKIFYYYE